MVSIGTIISLGLVAAVAAGGYALYRNADKVGGALSRGVETSISNPLGNYLDNLFKVPGATAQVAGTPATSTPAPALDYVPGTNNPADSRTWNPGYVPPADQDFLPPAKTTVTSKSSRPTLQSQAGYYYFDVKGSQYDTQQLLTSQQATQLKAAAVLDPALLAVRYIGQSKLNQAGFNLFGKSQGYL